MKTVLPLTFARLLGLGGVGAMAQTAPGDPAGNQTIPEKDLSRPNELPKRERGGSTGEKLERQTECRWRGDQARAWRRSGHRETCSGSQSEFNPGYSAPWYPRWAAKQNRLKSVSPAQSFRMKWFVRSPSGPFQPRDKARGVPSRAAHFLDLGVELVDQGGDGQRRAIASGFL